jgi:hypothetical protein
MRRLLCLLALSAAFLSAAIFSAGCQLVGVAADRLVGQPPIPARYVPGETTQLLVLVENYQDPAGATGDARRVATMVGEVLETRKVAVILSQEKLQLLRDARLATFSSMSVVDIGKAVGAQQVLYIDLGGVGVGVHPGSDVLRGRASASVKVIDVNTGAIKFPEDLSGGYPVDFTSPMRRSESGTTPDTVRGETLVGLSARIARLFYTYQPGDLEALGPGQ